MLSLIRKTHNIAKVKNIAESSKARLQKRQKEQNLNKILVQKQKNVYQDFKEFDRVEQFKVELSPSNKQLYSRLIDDLVVENDKKRAELLKLEKISYNQQDEYQQSVNQSIFQRTNDISSSKYQENHSFHFQKSPTRQQSTLNTTFLTLKQNQNPEGLQGQLENVKVDEENVNQMIYVNQETQDSLEQKIDQLKFTIGKMQRDIQDLEKEECLLNQKQEQLLDQELMAVRKKGIVKLTVKNYKQEIELDRQRANQCIKEVRDHRDNIFEQIKKEQQVYSLLLVKIDENQKLLEQQNLEIKQLDYTNEDLIQKLNESKNTLAYLDTLIELERMFIKGEIDKQDTLETESNQESIYSHRITNQNSVSKRNNQNKDLSFYSDRSNLSPTPRKNHHQKPKFIKLLNSKDLLSETDRQNLVKRIDFYYNEHGKGPEDIASYLIKQYKDFSLSSQSLQNAFEQLTQNKNIKSIELVQLDNYINEIQKKMGSSILNINDDSDLGFNLESEALKEIVTYGQLSLSNIKEFQENSQAQIQKLTETRNIKDSLSFRLFLNLVEILYRYVCLLKLQIQRVRNPDQELVEFYHEFSQFICTFRLGFNPKRNIKIDSTKYVNEVFSNIKESNPPLSPQTNVSMSKEIYTPKVKLPSLFPNNYVLKQFSDAVKEFKQVTIQKLNLEEEQSKNESEKFFEKLNFVPFSKTEQELIFKSVFPNASCENLSNWIKLIKDSILFYYASEQELLDYLKSIQQNYENEQEDFQISQVFNHLPELQNKAYQQHFDNIQIIFEFFQKLRLLLEKKKNQLFETCDNQVKWNFTHPVKQKKKQPEFMRNYVIQVSQKRNNYLNFQGEMQEPITFQKKIVTKNDKDKSKDNANNEEVKKMIYKLAKSEKKIKLDQLNTKIKENKQSSLMGQEQPSKINRVPSFLLIEEDDYLDPKQLAKQNNMNENEFFDYERKREKYLIQEQNKQILQSIVKTENEQPLRLNQQEEQSTQMPMQQQKQIEQQIKNIQESYPRNTHYSNNRQSDKPNRMYTEIIQHNKIISKLNQIQNKKDQFNNEKIFTKIKNYCPKTKEYFKTKIQDDHQNSSRSRFSLQRSEVFFRDLYEQKSLLEFQSTSKKFNCDIINETITQSRSGSNQRSYKKVQYQSHLNMTNDSSDETTIDKSKQSNNIMNERCRSTSEKLKQSVKQKNYFHFQPQFKQNLVNQQQNKQLAYHQSLKRFDLQSLQANIKNLKSKQQNERRMKKSYSFTKSKPVIIFNGNDYPSKNILPNVTKKGESLECSPFSPSFHNTHYFSQNFNTSIESPYSFSHLFSNTPLNYIENDKRQFSSILINKNNQ